jgi:hypothetical protein
MVLVGRVLVNRIIGLICVLVLPEINKQELDSVNSGVKSLLPESQYRVSRRSIKKSLQTFIGYLEQTLRRRRPIYFMT